LEMHGSGTFFDPRLNDAAKFPHSRGKWLRERA
jgi:hypothetical protein